LSHKRIHEKKVRAAKRRAQIEVSLALFKEIAKKRVIVRLAHHTDLIGKL
jgi:hypothetical protein